MLKKYFILILILLNINNISAEILQYNSNIFNPDEKTVIEPFEFYNIANIYEIKNGITFINIGDNFKVRPGFIYTLYHNNEINGEIRITNVKEEYSESRTIATKLPISVGDKLIFSGKIDSYDNPSYSRRYEKKISGKITIVMENFCLINLSRKDELKVGMKFSVFDADNNIGSIEVVDITPDKDSLCNILEQKSKIKVDNIVKSNPKDAGEWLTLAKQWETKPDSQIDAVYAYEKAIKSGGETLLETINNFTTLINILVKEASNKDKVDEAIIYLRKIKKFDPKYQERYDDLQNKALNKGKMFWRTGNYIQAIRFFEQLEQTDEVNKLLSDTYTEVGQEFQAQGKTEHAIYAFEKAVKINPNNINYNKNLFAIYSNQNIYDKSIDLLFKIKNFTADAKEKKWTEEQIDIMERAKEKRAPNYQFIDINETRFTLDSLQGYAVLIILWSTSYEKIIEEFKFLYMFKEKYKDKPIAIIAVNNDQKTIDMIKKFFEENELKINYNVAFTADNLKFIFPTGKVPQSALLNKKGALEYQKVGDFDEKVIEDILNKIFNE